MLQWQNVGLVADAKTNHVEKKGPDFWHSFSGGICLGQTFSGTIKQNRMVKTLLLFYPLPAASIYIVSNYRDST